MILIHLLQNLIGEANKILEMLQKPLYLENTTTEAQAIENILARLNKQESCIPFEYTQTVYKIVIFKIIKKSSINSKWLIPFRRSHTIKQ